MTEQNSGKKIFCIVATSGISLINFHGVFISELVEMGFRVVCVSIEADAEIGEEVRALGAEYNQVAGDRTGIGLFSGFQMIAAYTKFFKALKPDYCFLYMSKPIAFGGIAAIRSGIKHINIFVNGLENAYYRTGLKDVVVRLVMSAFYRHVAKYADNVFFLNPDDRNYFVSHQILSGENGSVVPGDGVDMEHFARTELPKEPVILMVARLLWSKGIREFLEAVKIVKQANPAVKVLLVGGLDDNDEALSKDDLEKCIGEFDIEYCGFTRDVRPYLQRCSIFVLPSYHEGLPRSVIEAMSVGRPVIVTDVPGCRETTENGVNGFIVPPRNSSTLAEKILILVNDADLREQMAIKSYEFCRDRFEVHKANQVLFQKMFH